MLEFASKIRICMPHEKARQSAENHDYAALDLVAEGQHERARPRRIQMHRFFASLRIDG